MMRLAVFSFLLAITGGCNASGAAVPPLDGSEWKLVRVDGKSAARPDKARIAFRDGELHANAGCNGMGGPYRLNGTQLIAGPLMQTEMYCEGEVWKQEKALSALLVGVPQIVFDDRHLTLISSGHRAELERVNLPQPAP